MRLRPPTPADAEAVIAVLTARDMVDIGEPHYTLADLRDEWRASEFDLGADALLAEDERGQVVAYAVTRRPGTLVAVAPEHEGRGIGAQLLEWAEKRAVEQGRDRHRQWIGPGNERAKELLSRSGYRYARSHWRMIRVLDGPLRVPPNPDGLVLRPVDVQRDAASLYALDAAAFAAVVGAEPVSAEAFSEEFLGAHNVAPELSLVAERHGAPRAFLLTLRWRQESAGYVDILAVHPDHQGRGLGTTLLEHAFARFAAAGLGNAQLTVASDNPRAVTLYERVGMSVKFRYDTYERPLVAPIPPG